MSEGKNPRKNRFSGSWKAKAFLTMLGFFAALVAAELIVRVLYPPMEVEVSRVDYSRDVDKIKSFGKLGADVIDGYPDKALYIMTPAGKRMLPGAVVTVRHHALSGRDVTIRVNSFGFRGPELPEKKARPRALFLGDSVTFSDFMEEKETFVHRVGENLRKDGFDADTMNAGVGSIGMENELAILLDTGFAAKPDVVVLDFYLNDAEPSPGVWIAQPPACLRWSALARFAYSAASKLRNQGNHPAAKEFDEWRPVVEDRLASNHDQSPDARSFHAKVISCFQDWGSAWSDDAWDARFAPCLKAFKKACEARGVGFVVVCFPVSAQIETEKLRDYPQRKMKELCGELDVPYLDILPELRKLYRARRKPLFYDQCHPTPETAADIADWIAAFLERTVGTKLKRLDAADKEVVK